MLAEEYSEDFGRRIFKRFKESGWNIYRLASREVEIEELIGAGPVPYLEADKFYIMFPAVPDPTDAKQVLYASTLKKIKTGMYFPKLFIVDKFHPIPVFSLRRACVNICTTEEEIEVSVTYVDFVESLDTL